MKRVFFHWTESYNTSIAKIDEQHQQLVALLNDLYDAFMEKKDKEYLSNILAELAAYSQYHFVEEEQIFKGVGYPDEERHLMRHQTFIDDIQGFISDYAAGKGSLTLQLMLYLQKWLADHITGADQLMAAWVKENRPVHSSIWSGIFK